MKLCAYLIIGSLLCSCVSSNSLNPLKENLDPSEIQIYTKDEVMPLNVSKIGSVKVGYPTFLGLIYVIDHRYKSYYEVMRELQSRAALMGGNMIVLQNNQDFLLGRTEYHYVRGDVFFMNESLKKNAKFIPDNEVLLHIYSYSEYIPRKGLYVNDSLVMKLRNNFKKTVRLKKTKILSLEFEDKERLQIKLDSFPENEVYIRCFGRLKNNYKPLFQLMPFEQGKLEYESYLAKHNN